LIPSLCQRSLIFLCKNMMTNTKCGHMTWPFIVIPRFRLT
jgi:hypothetical protein